MNYTIKLELEKDVDITVIYEYLPADENYLEDVEIEKIICDNDNVYDLLNHFGRIDEIKEMVLIKISQEEEEPKEETVFDGVINVLKNHYENEPKFI